MKNLLALVAGLMIVSTPALASRARLEALGESKNGSFYIDDSRNVFLNPAAVNKYKKKLMLEWGGNAAGSAAADSIGASQAQGGFTNTFGDYTYMIYLNNNSDDTINALQAINTVFIGPDRTIEAAIGMGDYGFSVIYAGTDNSANSKKFSQLAFRLGGNFGDLSAFATVAALTNSAIGLDDATNTEAKGKIGFKLGATYNMGDMTAYGKFNMRGMKLNVANTDLGEGNNMDIEVGAGFKKEVNKTFTMFTRTGLAYSTANTKALPSGTELSKTKAYNIPLVVGAEASALSWLTLRGSITQSLFGQNFTGGAAHTSFVDSTSVAAGAGMTFGDVTVDALLAQGTANNAANGDAPGFGGSNAGTNSNQGFGDNMLGRVSMTYNF